ncbi:ABC transporter permease [Globicatella sp. HMSC072A10]|uniref:ABC transporter permease n=1 Tax=Globicatella sp. HMSC072A10 TaxID=1739315 RepID=UPI0008D31901|nr:ABC transporter permease [Globicatella sp. HMSC072A10]OFK62061.1 ABC transporter permease [Globicatella sp. HMSC072A10]
MNIQKNAWAYITRKKHRTLIIFLILMFILTSLFTCLTILNASHQIENNVFKISNSSLSITKNDSSSFAMKDFEQLKSIKEIEVINPEYQSLAKLVDHQVIEGEQQIFREEMPEQLSNVVDVQATNDSQRDLLFSSGVFTLVEGQPIQADSQHNVLVHQEFADKNGLKLNDTIRFQLVDNETLKVHETMEYTISGIFTGKKQESYTGLSSDFSENTFFVDYQTTQDQLGLNKDQTITNKLTLHTDSVENLESAHEKIKNLPIDWSKYEVEKNDKAFQKTLTALKSMQQIIEIVTNAMILGGLTVLSLILILWLRERIYEIGIFLSIGMSKKVIISQFILELLMVSVPAALVSFIVGLQLNKFYLTDFFNSITNESIGNQMLPIENMRDNLTHFGIAYGLLLVIILLAVIVSCSIILLKKPKTILSEIS